MRDYMKNTDADRAVSGRVVEAAADVLRQFMERFEALEAQKKDIGQHQKEVMAEAKGQGYDTKAIKKIVALRKRKPDDVAEEDAILDMYRAALGMS